MCVRVYVCARVPMYVCRPAVRLSGCLCPVPRELAGWQDTLQRCPCERCLSSVSLSSGRPWTWLWPRRMLERLCTVKREQRVQPEANTVIKGWGKARQQWKHFSEFWNFQGHKSITYIFSVFLYPVKTLKRLHLESILYLSRLDSCYGEKSIIM